MTDKKEGIPKADAFFFMFAQHGSILTGASPQHTLIAGSVQPTTRVSIVSWNLEEVGGKHLA